MREMDAITSKMLTRNIKAHENFSCYIDVLMDKCNYCCSFSYQRLTYESNFKKYRTKTQNKYLFLCITKNLTYFLLFSLFFIFVYILLFLTFLFLYSFLPLAFVVKQKNYVQKITRTIFINIHMVNTSLSLSPSSSTLFKPLC